MGMPNHLVLVRHGQSEANIIQKLRKADPNYDAPAGFFDRHDSRVRLSPLGREQAAKTGEWLRSEFPNGFDRYYVSSLMRTRETAGRLALGGRWYIDDRWRERDWGEFGTLNHAQQVEQYVHSTKLKGQSMWYWCPPGGEALAGGVQSRFKDILGTLHREMDGKNVIAVTHGETMEVGRVVLERLLPEEWEVQERDENYKLANCMALDYSRLNPETGEQSNHLEWRRAICAWDESKSWQAGEWVHIPRQTYDDAQLLEMVEQYPNLL